MWEGSTENKTVCNALLANLIERGLDPEQPRLFVSDGGEAIRAAVGSTFGRHAVVQRCRAHKRRNVLTTCPSRSVPSSVANWTSLEGADAHRAEAQLRALAKHLEVKHPGAAASLLASSGIRRMASSAFALACTTRLSADSCRGTRSHSSPVCLNGVRPLLAGPHVLFGRTPDEASLGPPSLGTAH